MCYLVWMFRLVSGAFGIVAVALLWVATLAAEYPWQSALVAWIGFVLARQFVVERQQRIILSLDIASMSPVDYEMHCAEVLRAAGWSVRRIGAGGDQGVDVLAVLRGTRAAIQCKKYTRAAGNAAVQQVVAGKRHHGAQIAVVVCPVGYTRSAKKLADSNGVLLLSHADLSQLAALARVPCSISAAPARPTTSDREARRR
jgi:HJR/Mrr/RecB family endonuclease